jgi:hypothetical protein
MLSQACAMGEKVEAAGIAPAAPVYQVVLTIASVEPLVSDLFSVTLTPAVPAYLACVGPTTPTDPPGLPLAVWRLDQV